MPLNKKIKKNHASALTPIPYDINPYIFFHRVLMELSYNITSTTQQTPLHKHTIPFYVTPAAVLKMAPSSQNTIYYKFSLYHMW